MVRTNLYGLFVHTGPTEVCVVCDRLPLDAVSADLKQHVASSTSVDPISHTQLDMTVQILSLVLALIGLGAYAGAGGAMQYTSSSLTGHACCSPVHSNNVGN